MSCELHPGLLAGAVLLRGAIQFGRGHPAAKAMHGDSRISRRPTRTALPAVQRRRLRHECGNHARGSFGLASKTEHACSPGSEVMLRYVSAGRSYEGGAMNALLRILATLLALAIHPAPAADAWPTHTITIVAPGAAGSTSDFFARLMSDGLAKELGRTVIVDNRAGAGTLLGSQLVAHAKPDGHTLLIGAAALSSSPHLYKSIAI